MKIRLSHGLRLFVSPLFTAAIFFIILLNGGCVKTPDSPSNAPSSPVAPKISENKDPAENKNLANAKALVDRVVATLEAEPEAGWEKHSKKIGQMIADADLDEFTKEEYAQLNAYTTEKAQKVKPILDKLDAEAKKLQKLKPVKKNSATGNGDSSSGGPDKAFQSATCFTSCVAMMQFECGTNRVFGVCFGAWGCQDGRGAHECLSVAGGDVGDDSTCKNDSECPPGFKCATWATKKNECLKECDKDSDCSGGQKCKKPVGTNFKRCK